MLPRRKGHAPERLALRARQVLVTVADLHVQRRAEPVERFAVDVGQRAQVVERRLRLRADVLHEGVDNAREDVQLGRVPLTMVVF